MRNIRFNELSKRAGSRPPGRMPEGRDSARSMLQISISVTWALTALLFALAGSLEAKPKPPDVSTGAKLGLIGTESLTNTIAGPTKWHTDLETSLSLAARRNKPVLVYFTSPFCGWCKQMDSRTFRAPDVRAGMESFVLTKIDTLADETTAARFRIRGTPAMVFLSPEGRETFRVSGFVDTERILSLFTEILGGDAAKTDGRVKGLIEGLSRGALADGDWPDLMMGLKDEAQREQIAKTIAGMNPWPRANLVQQLTHPLLAVRLGALEILEELAGDDHGYNPWRDAVNENAEALNRWKSWSSEKENEEQQAQLFKTLSEDEVASYLRDLLGDDYDRAVRARHMLRRGGKASLDGIKKFVTNHPELPGASIDKLREVKYALLLPNVRGKESAGLAHRLVFGNLDVQLRTLRDIAAARRPAVPVIRDYLEDEEPLVRETAVEALVNAGGRIAVPFLAAHLEKEKDGNVVYQILRSLGSLPSQIGLIVLRKHLTHENEDFVVASLESIAKLKASGAAADVGKALKDERWRVRVAALKTTQKLRFKQLSKTVVDLLEDEDEFVRSTAVEVIAHLDPKDSIKKLEELFLANDDLKGPVTRAIYAADVPFPERLVQALNGETPSVLLGILDHLETADLKLAPLLEKMAVHENDDVACSALRLIGEHGLEHAPFQQLTAKQLREGNRRRRLTLFRSLAPDDELIFGYNPTARTVTISSDSTPKSTPETTTGTSAIDDIFAAFENPGQPAAQTKNNNAATNGAAMIEDLFKAFENPAASAPTTPTKTPTNGAAAIEDLFKAFETAEAKPDQTAPATNTGDLDSLFAAFESPQTTTAAPTENFFETFRRIGREALAKEDDQELRDAAALFLTKLGELEGAEVLAGNLDELTSDQKRLLAGGLTPLRRQQAVPLFRALLADSDEYVRRRMVSALLAQGANSACVDLVFEELTRPGTLLQPSEIYYEINNAAEKRSLRRGISEHAVEILKRDDNPNLTTAALIFLKMAWTSSAAEHVTRFTTAENPWQRRAALYALGRHDSDAFAQLADQVAEDSSEFVREIIPALYSGKDSPIMWNHYFGPDRKQQDYDWRFNSSRKSLTDASRKLLHKLTEDSSPRVRFLALFALLTHREKIDLSALISVIETFPRNSELLRTLAGYVYGNYRTLGKSFGVLLPHLEFGQHTDAKHEQEMQKHFGVNPDADVLATVYRAGRTRKRIEATFLDIATNAPTAANETVQLVFFYKPGCEACALVRDRIDRIREAFPTLDLIEHDINKTASVLLNEALAERFGVPSRVRLVAPAVFAADGFLIKDDITMDRLGSLLARSAVKPATDWLSIPEPELAVAQEQIADRYHATSAGVILAAGLLDGINPCAFATIIFLLSYLQVTRKRPHEIAWIGISYILGVFSAYMVIGLGLLQVTAMLSRIQWIGHSLNYVMGAFALLIMALCIRDGVLCLRGQMGDMTLQLPDFLKRRIHGVIRSGVRQAHFVLVAFFMGVTVSLLELACTGQVYLPTITYMIQSGETGALGRLLMYNLAFIAPLTVIFILAFRGLTSETLLKLLKRHAATVKFSTAGLFLLLFVFLIFGHQILQAAAH